MTKGFLYLGLAALIFWASFRMGSYGYALYQQGAASQEWAEAEAVVSKFKFRTKKSSSKPVSNPHVDVTYQYEVDGQSYTGERLGFGPYSKGQLIRPRRGRATIYYDPNDPKESVYIKGISRPNMYLMGVVGLFGASGFFFSWLAIKSFVRFGMID